MSKPMLSKDCQQAVEGLVGWSLSDDQKSIRKIFKFKDFNDAFAFMGRVAKVADKMDHHPDWSNSYNKVDITLSTHDAGGLTDKDIQLAQESDQAYAAA